MPVKSPQLDFGTSAPRAERQELAVGAILLAGFAIGADEALLAAIEAIQQTSPFRHMVTPGGWLMSVAMSAYEPANHDFGDRVANVHGTAVNVLLILIAIHASAALVHQFVWKDGLLRRMLPGS